MGGRNKIATLGPLVVFVSAAGVLNAPNAFSGDLAISAPRTTPVETANPDGAGPGHVTVEGTGSISASAGTIVTLNSNNAVINNGTIANDQESNATGVGILTTLNGAASNLTGSVTNNNIINVFGPVQGSSLVTADVFNAGIRLSGLGTFTGDITNDSTALATGNITVGGHSSAGIAIQSNIIGNVANRGVITVGGERSYGILTTGHIAGNLTANGAITVGDKDAIGVYVGGGVDGVFSYNGASAVGTGARLTSTNGVTVTRLDPLPAKAGVWVASNIGQGMFMGGNRLTLTEESLDPAAAAAAPQGDSSINLVGGGPGLLFGQGGLNTTLANITINPGPDTGGYAFKGQGNVLVAGSILEVEATAVGVRGILNGGTAYTTTLTGGFWNDKGNLQAVSADARAIGFHIGDYGVVPRIQNDGDMLVNAQDSTTNNATGELGTKGGDAYGVLVESAGSLTSFANTGNMLISAQGPTTSAYVVLDRSGQLNSFTNSGAIAAVIQAGSTGKAIAVDLSANTTGVTLTNTGGITGDVLLGAGDSSLSVSGINSGIGGNITFQAGATKSGNNTVTLNNGQVTGLINLGNGTHTVTLSNGAKLDGGLAQGTGTLALGVDASQITFLSTQPINASSASFTGASVVNFDINNSATTLPGGILQSAGDISFGADSKITTTFTGLIDGEKTITVVRAGALSLGAPLSEIASTPNSYINTSAFSISSTDPNSLLLTVRRKTSDELALGPNTAAIYDAFAPALNQDIPVVTAFSALETEAQFTAAIRQLMPDSSGALQQAALNNQDMAAGAIRRRLVGVARNGMPDHAAGDVASFWVQALGDYGNQDGEGEQAGYEVWGLGIALGADFPVFDGSTNLGISFAETWHSANLKVSNKSPVEFYNTQLNFYGRYTAQSFYLQGSVGGGYNSYSQQRQVTIGNVSRLAVGKWKGYEYGGVVEAGYMTRFSAYQFNPYVRVAYLKNHENAYTETAGGTGVDLTVAARSPDNARAAVGFTLDRNFPIFYDSYIEAEFRGNYTREFKNDPYAVTAQFATGPSFTNFSNQRKPNRANLGIGIAHKDSYSSVSVDYDTEISNGYLAHKAGITARFRF